MSIGVFCTCSTSLHLDTYLDTCNVADYLIMWFNVYITSGHG